MVLHLPGLAIVAALSGVASLGMYLAYLNVDNKNNRRYAAVVASLVSMLMCAQYVYYIYVPPCATCRTDGLTSQWERALFVPLNTAVLVVAYGLFAGFDWASYMLLILTSVFMLLPAFLTAILSSGYPKYWWFVGTTIVTLFITVLKFRCSERDLDGASLMVLLIGTLAAGAEGLAFLLGPEIHGVLSEPIQFTIYALAESFLFIGVPCLIVLFQGGDDSYYNKGRHHLGKNLARESTRLTNMMDE